MSEHSCNDAGRKVSRETFVKSSLTFGRLAAGGPPTAPLELLLLP